MLCVEAFSGLLIQQVAGQCFAALPKDGPIGDLLRVGQPHELRVEVPRREDMQGNGMVPERMFPGGCSISAALRW